MTTSRKFLWSGAIALAVLAACTNERAITTQPIGNIGFGVNLAKWGTNLPRGRVVYPATAIASGGADSIIISLAGVDSLTTGSYNVWVANDSATKFFKLTGNLVVSRLDTTLNAAGDPVFTPSTRTYTGVSSFTVGGQNSILRFASARAAAAGIATTDSMNVVIISIETSAAATAPGTSRPMWGRRSDASATFIAGMRFGNFKPRLLEQYVFATSTASATAFTASMPIIPRGRVEVRGPVMVVNDSNYYRPPVGYYYAAWAIKVDTLGRFIDTIPLGDKASPYPVRASFYDADVSVPDPTAMFGSPVGAPLVIFAAAHRVTSDTIPDAVTVCKSGQTRPWCNFGWAFVTLQNKSAPKERMGAPVVMLAGMPSSILGR